ncbi:MAG: hypothetical protein L0I48_02325 [Lactococcus plantarum]|nr:hypothetical protein [Lactococcus plantarum]MDN6084683.1 hypothetical protein [Lactococcus plantarum]
MKKILVIATALMIALTVSLGIMLKASAQTTADYYQSHGAFNAEKNVVKAGDWETFIRAYQDEAVTKIMMTADITDSSKDGPYGPTNYRRKNSIEIDGASHQLTLKRYHGLRTSARPKSFKETSNGKEQSRALFHMHDISIRQNLDGKAVDVGHYSSSAFVGASEAYQSQGFENSMYESEMTSNWYFRFGNITTEQDNNEATNKGVARLIMAYGADVSLYGNNTLSTSAENMYVGALTVEDNTKWQGKTEYDNLSTVWFTTASPKTATGSSKSLTIGKNCDITLSNSKYNYSPAISGQYLATVIGEDSKVTVNNTSIAWRFDQTKSSLVIKKGAVLSLNSSGKGKVLQFGNGKGQSGVVSDCQVKVESGGALLVAGQFDVLGDIGIIDFNGSGPISSTRAFDASNCQIVVASGAVFDVQNQSSNTTSKKHRAINLRNETNQLIFEDQHLKLWQFKTSVTSKADVELEKIRQLIFKGETTVEVSDDVKDAKKVKQLRLKDYRRLATKAQNTVDVNDKELPTIEILTPKTENDVFNTQEDRLTVTGIAKDNMSVKSVSYMTYDKSGEVLSEGVAEGIDKWQVKDIVLKTGVTYISIIAEDSNGNKAVKELSVRKKMTEVKFKDNVLLVTEDQQTELDSKLKKLSIDDNKTPGQIFDDITIMTFDKNNKIEEALNQKVLQLSDILYFNPGSVIKEGFTGRLEKRVEESEGTVSYHFTTPDILDVIDGDMYIDEQVSLDFNTEGAFIYDASGNDRTQGLKKASVKKETTSKTPTAKEILKFITPNVKLNSKGGALSVGDSTKGLVLYDPDGNRKTEDNLNLLFKCALEDVKFDVVQEYTDKILWQNRSVTSYNRIFEVGARTGILESTGDWKSKLKQDRKKVEEAQDLKESFKETKEESDKAFTNQIKFSNLVKIKGSDVVSDSIIVAYVGMPLIKKTVKPFLATTIDKAVEEIKFDPMASLFLMITPEGKLEIGGKMLYENKEYNQIGYNFQRVNRNEPNVIEKLKGDNKTVPYEGKQGTADKVEALAKKDGDNQVLKRQGSGASEYSSIFYNTRRVEKNKFEAGISANVSGSISAGPAFGLLIAGCMPAVVTAQGYMDMDMKNEMSYSKDFLTSGPAVIDKSDDAKFNVTGGIKFLADFQLKADILGIPMINLSGQKVKKFELFKTSDEKNDALKIVLKWSDIPRDLDSHLFTPSQTHLYYGNKNQFDKQGNVMASLNTDITSGFGPEVVKINQSEEGIYYYSIYNYRDNLANQLKNSRASISVYQKDSSGKEDKLLKHFTVPTTGDGLWWNVFEYDSKSQSITSVNAIEDVPSWQKGIKSKALQVMPPKEENGK